MSKQIPRSPAEIERQAREFAAMREAIAQYGGGVNKIPTGKRYDARNHAKINQRRWCRMAKVDGSKNLVGRQHF